MMPSKLTKNRISQKAGSFTESVIREMTREAIKYGAVNLGQGFPDFNAPEDIKLAAQKAIADDKNQYAITWGVKEFRDAIVKKTKWFLDLDVDPETELTVTCGSTEGMIAGMLKFQRKCMTMRRNVFLFLILTVGLIQTVFAQETIPVSNSRGYLLGPGDAITTKVLGEKDFDFEAIVDENGNIEVPFFDKPITAMCKSERELRTEVTGLLSRYLKSPQVSLRITERKSRPPTTISGAIRSPQQVILMRQARLSELLAVAGGETEEAGGIIQVIRPQAPMCGTKEEIAEWKAQVTNPENFPMRLYSLDSVKKGNSEANPVIYPGDYIMVEKAKPVYFVGEVKGGQGGVFIKDNGLSLVNAIAMIGGVNREAKTKDIKIYRQKPDSIEKEIISVNLDLIKTQKQKDIMLQAYDIVEVDKARDSIGKIILNTITNSATGGLGQIVTGGATRILY